MVALRELDILNEDFFETLSKVFLKMLSGWFLFHRKLQKMRQWSEALPAEFRNLLHKDIFKKIIE